MTTTEYLRLCCYCSVGFDPNPVATLASYEAYYADVVNRLRRTVWTYTDAKGSKTTVSILGSVRVDNKSLPVLEVSL